MNEKKKIKKNKYVNTINKKTVSPISNGCLDKKSDHLLTQRYNAFETRYTYTYAHVRMHARSHVQSSYPLACSRFDSGQRARPFQ